MTGKRPLRIGLGTAQLGLEYGVTNRRGRVPEREAATILDEAAAMGIDTLDTAFLYGDSEAVIGRLASRGSFRIVTKTPKLDAASGTALQSCFQESLERLQTEHVYGLLFHDPADLTGPDGGQLWRQAEELKAAGSVEKIGVSVYKQAEIDALLDLYPLDLVQLPWSPLDRRMSEGGALDRVTFAGVEIHARSLFLQGLLLQDPSSIDRRFRPIADAVAELHAAYAAAGLRPLEGVLATAFRDQRIARFICGVTSLEELRQLAAAAALAAERDDFDPPPAPRLDARFLNPARWTELGAEAASR